MFESNSKFAETLLFIKRNPGCDSTNLDADLVDYLYGKNLVKGSRYTPLSTPYPKFINLKITIDGENSLVSKGVVVHKTPEAPSWHTNPFIIFALSIVAGIILAGITFFLGWS